MEITTTKICGTAIICIIALLVIKQTKTDFPPILRICITVVFSGIIVGMVAPIVKFITVNLSESTFKGYEKNIMKALGIAFLTQLCAQVCRDCGETNLASNVETIGKTELLLISLPLFEEIFEIVRGILSWQ